MTRKVITLTGPSCSGKSTLTQKLCDQYSGVQPVISYTTRAMRAGEVNGVDYHFIDEAVFIDMVRNHEFIEWINFPSGSDIYYGYSKESVEKPLKEGIIPIFVIEPNGLLQLCSYLKREGIELESIWLDVDQDLAKERFITRMLNDIKGLELDGQIRVMDKFVARYSNLKHEFDWPLKLWGENNFVFRYKYVNNNHHDMVENILAIANTLGLATLKNTV